MKGAPENGSTVDDSTKDIGGNPKEEGSVSLS